MDEELDLPELSDEFRAMMPGLEIQRAIGLLRQAQDSPLPDLDAVDAAHAAWMSGVGLLVAMYEEPVAAEIYDACLRVGQVVWECLMELAPHAQPGETEEMTWYVDQYSAMLRAARAGSRNEVRRILAERREG